MRRWRRPWLSTVTVRSGSELYGGMATRAVASWSREAGAAGFSVTTPIGRTVARVSAEEHMANYQAARALMGKGVTRVKERRELSRQQRKEGRQEVRGEEGETKEMTLATAGFVSQDMLTSLKALVKRQIVRTFFLFC